MFLITILHQEDIRSAYCQCHVDSLTCTESNVNKHKSNNVMFTFYLSDGNKVMTESAHWWSWS